MTPRGRREEPRRNRSGEPEGNAGVARRQPFEVRGVDAGEDAVPHGGNRRRPGAGLQQARLAGHLALSDHADDSVAR
ncbi:MAG: hypothetical protein V9G12_25655 [Microthrixaceae bacterium]